MDSNAHSLRLIDGGLPRARTFEALIGQHYSVLFRVAYRMTRSVPDAEDLVQEVCVRAFPKMDDLAKLDDPRSWLMLVMRRVFIDQTRRYDKSHVESFDIDGAPEAQSDLPGPEEEADRLKHTERLDRAWQHLSTDQRNLLSLHDLEGHSLAELQEMTGLKEGTLKSRLHRARIKLGRLLQAQQSPTAMRI